MLSQNPYRKPKTEHDPIYFGGPYGEYAAFTAEEVAAMDDIASKRSDGPLGPAIRQSAPAAQPPVSSPGPIKLIAAIPVWVEMLKNWSHRWNDEVHGPKPAPPSTSTTTTAPPTVATTTPAAPLTLGVFIDMLNAERFKWKLKSLSVSADMVQISWINSSQCAGKDRWGSGSGIGHYYMGDCSVQNAAWNVVEHDLLDEWMNSPPHRKNLLDPNITECGLALHGPYATWSAR